VNPTVSVSVLNYKQASYVPFCLNALLRQTYPHIEILFSDNGSADGSAQFVQANYPNVEIIAHDTNLYYSKAHNIAIRESHGEFVLTLNVDVMTTPTFVEQMVAAMELDRRIGMVSGKLLRMGLNLRPLKPPIIDSTGLWFSSESRHFDRGSQEKDEGQYDNVEYVFGPSGAAAAYRRDMLEDVAFDGEYLDEDFVIYREDADLAWHAQLLGWRGLYTPAAVGYHLRRIRPDHSRRDNIPLLNMHSVKNRFLMRLKNQTPHHAAHVLVPTLKRDLLVVGYVALVEHRSLSAFLEVIRLWPRTMERRRQIMKKKRVDDRYIAQWFSSRPVSLSSH
jgi:GT2 family glycosyltransferase